MSEPILVLFIEFLFSLLEPQVLRYNTGSAVRPKNSRQALTNGGLSKGIRRVKFLVAVSHTNGHTLFSKKSFYASCTSPWPCMSVWQTAVCQMKSDESSLGMCHIRCVTHTWAPTFSRKPFLCLPLPFLTMYEVPKSVLATVFFPVCGPLCQPNLFWIMLTNFEVNPRW